MLVQKKGRDCWSKLFLGENKNMRDAFGHALIFPDGNDGYHIDICKKERVKKFTATELYSFQFLMTHEKNFLQHYR